MDLLTIQNRLTNLEADLLACQTETEPSVPLNCVAVGNIDNVSATVAFSMSASDGGSPITSYYVYSTPGGFCASGATSPIIVTGLSLLMQSYTFEIQAINAIGHSLPCATNSVGGSTTPGTPTSVTAVAGEELATVTFVAPVSDGYSPILRYDVVSNPGSISAYGPTSPIIVPVLSLVFSL